MNLLVIKQMNWKNVKNLSRKFGLKELSSSFRAVLQRSVGMVAAVKIHNVNINVCTGNQYILGDFYIQNDPNATINTKMDISQSVLISQEKDIIRIRLNQICAEYISRTYDTSILLKINSLDIEDCLGHPYKLDERENGEDDGEEIELELKAEEQKVAKAKKVPTKFFLKGEKPGEHFFDSSSIYKRLYVPNDDGKQFVTCKVALTSGKSPDSKLCNAGTALSCSILPITLAINLDLISTLLRFAEGEKVENVNVSGIDSVNQGETKIESNIDNDTATNKRNNIEEILIEELQAVLKSMVVDINIEELHLNRYQNPKHTVIVLRYRITKLKIKYKMTRSLYLVL